MQVSRHNANKQIERKCTNKAREQKAIKQGTTNARKQAARTVIMFAAKKASKQNVTNQGNDNQGQKMQENLQLQKLKSRPAEHKIASN